MTRQEAIDAAPAGRGTYWSSLVMAGMGCLFFLGLSVFALRRSVTMSVIIFAMAMVMAAMMAQSAERLFYPERAAERTASLSDSQRIWIRRLRVWLVVAYGVIGAIWMVLFLVGGTMHQLSIDLQVFWWSPYMVASILADLQGERMGVTPFVGRRGVNRPQGPLVPLRSEHWGERG
ncbi:MAG: hypothetical protein WBY53_05185 [Acidobacteriaceae bacterium]